MLQRVLLIALAGAAGTLSRYGLSGLAQRLGGASFPFGTLAVNTTGCFLAGLFWVLFEHRWPVTAETRTIIMIGFMGAFTTFSSYVLESGELFRSSQWLYGAGNLILQNVLGFGMLLLGAAAGRLI